MTWDERSGDLEARARALFDKCKDGSAPGAGIAMIELRNLMPEMLDAVQAMRGQIQARERPPVPIDGETGTRRLVHAMRAADGFVAETREALAHGPKQGWYLALMELREALERLPPSPVE